MRIIDYYSVSFSGQPSTGYGERSRRRSSSRFHTWWHSSAPCFGYTTLYSNITRHSSSQSTCLVVSWKSFTLSSSSFMLLVTSRCIYNKCIYMCNIRIIYIISCDGNVLKFAEIHRTAHCLDDGNVLRLDPRHALLCDFP